MTMRVFVAAASAALTAVGIFSLANVFLTAADPAVRLSAAIGTLPMYVAASLWFGFPIAFVAGAVLLFTALKILNNRSRAFVVTSLHVIGALAGAILLVVMSPWRTGSLDISFETVVIGALMGLGAALTAWMILRREWPVVLK